MNIVDDFLDTESFEPIKSALTSFYEIGWFHQPVVTGHEKDSLDTHFIHTFFANSYGRPRGIQSELYDLFLPLIDKLGVEALIRLRANNYPRTTKKIQHGFHVDHNYPHKTAILYVNTNDGFTIMKDGKKVKSVENRVVMFDGEIKHCSTTCTDKLSRIVVNVNYI